MTSASGVVGRYQHGANIPTMFALGGVLVISSAVGILPPTHTWTATSVGQEYSLWPSQEPAPVDQTSSGLPKASEAREVGASTPSAKHIAEIRALVGLKTDQVGRLFGVSRRSVHNWINGNAMSPQHEERAAKILLTVQSLPGSTPAERRAAFLDSSHGTSLFHQFVASRNEAVPLQILGVSARERIGL